MKEGKSFEITHNQIQQAYKSVKANKGAGGIDGIDLDKYEKDLKNNLYKLWNRMASGSYFPKPVRGVEIPKKNEKMRLLGIPTVEDRVAQMVVRNELEPLVEPIFLVDYCVGQIKCERIRRPLQRVASITFVPLGVAKVAMA